MLARPSTPRLINSLLLGLLAVLTLAACGPSHLNTVQGIKVDDEATIFDTEDNRAVLNVLTRYQEAIEQRDTDAIDRLISDDYYENGGTSERTDDDYGRSGVPDAIARFAKAIKHIRVEIVVKDMRVDGDRAQVFYEYSYNYLFQTGEVPQWEAGREVNRMDLVRNDSGDWKITRGL